jgi:hypothetical protein
MINQIIIKYVIIFKRNKTNGQIVTHKINGDNNLDHPEGVTEGNHKIFVGYNQ